MTPRVSIVLPTYNRASLLKLAIESIQHQTFSEWELIIVNDGSTDQTEAVIDEYAKTDNRIRKINNPVNKKIPGSLNAGFKVARGQYFTWTSDDNLYKSDALEILASYLDRHPDVDLFSANMDIIDEKGQYVAPWLSPEAAEKRKPQDLVLLCNIGGAFLYRREIAEKVGDYEEKTFCAEDYDYWCRIAIAGNIHYSKQIIYDYRVHSEALTQKLNTHQQCVAKSIQLKYLPQFIERYQMSILDQAILARRLHQPWKAISARAKPLFLLITFAEKIQRILITLGIFWSRKLRRKLSEKSKFTPSWHFREP